MNTRELMRTTYPYVITTLEGGTKVMRNRDYEVILIRNKDTVSLPRETYAWNPIGNNEYLYDDATIPYKNTINKKKCERILNEWMDLMPASEAFRMKAGFEDETDVVLKYNAKKVGNVLQAHCAANNITLDENNYIELYGEALMAVFSAHTDDWFEANQDAKYQIGGLYAGPTSTVTVHFEDADTALMFKLAVGDYDG